MSMGIGINSQNTEEGELKRNLENVACGVWFTSQGNIMPKLIKYQDKDGLVHTISHIRIRSHEKKYYCGIPIQEYHCSSCHENQEYLFRLYYYLETNCWKISWE